jgi:hypothetical protein
VCKRWSVAVAADLGFFLGSGCFCCGCRCNRCCLGIDGWNSVVAGYGWMQGKEKRVEREGERERER